MTPISKETFLSMLDKKLPTHDPGLTRGKKYMDREVPEQYFIIQKWCLSQGSVPLETGYPDLSHILQGVEYIIQAATGKHSESVLSPGEIKLALGYLDCPELFEGGSLMMFDELRELVRTQLLTLPKGQIVINTVNNLPGYQGIFDK